MADPDGLVVPAEEGDALLLIVGQVPTQLRC